MVFMNKEFVKKMIKAEMLRYQAIKEILPEGMKKSIETLEKDAGNLLKDIALDIISENFTGQDNSKRPGQNTVSGTGDRKNVKRVQVDFN